MKGDTAFFDTNVLIYAFARDDPRAEIAEYLLAAGGMVGVQILNEFAAVAVRKLSMPWKDVLRALDAVRPSPFPVTIQVHDLALRITGQSGYHINDSLVIAAAQEAGCNTLYSEGMREHVIEGRRSAIRSGER